MDWSTQEGDTKGGIGLCTRSAAVGGRSRVTNWKKTASTFSLVADVDPGPEGRAPSSEDRTGKDEESNMTMLRVLTEDRIQETGDVKVYPCRGKGKASSRRRFEL